MKMILVVSLGIMLSGCGAPVIGNLNGKDIITTANMVRNASKLSTPGAQEQIITCVKDIFDPNRMNGC